MATDSRDVFVDPSKVRKEDQLAEYERIFRDGVCPFCLEHREEYTQGTRLYDGKYWWLFQNNWPYKNTRRHIMAVVREHGVYMNDVESGAGNEWLGQYTAIEKEDKYSLAAIEARFGFVMWTGASVAHLHTHMLIPDISKDNPDTFVEEYATGEILWEDEFWKVYKNEQPHELAREDFLVVSANKATYLKDLPTGSGDSLFKHLQKIEDMFDFTHGGFHCRIGERQQSGDTAGHLVFNVVAPDDDIYDDDSKKLRMQISDSPAVDFKVST